MDAPRPARRRRQRTGGRVTLAELEWLIGTWRGTREEDESEFFQSYRVRDDSTFSIVYFAAAACRPANPVTATLEQRGGRVYHTFGPARWW